MLPSHFPTKSILISALIAFALHSCNVEDIEKTRTYKDPSSGLLKYIDTDKVVSGNVIETDLNSGKILYSASYKKGMIDGSEKVFYLNGALQSVKYYSENNLDSSVEYYSDNKKRIERNLIDHTTKTWRTDGKYSIASSEGTIYYDADGIELKQGIEVYNIEVIEIGEQKWSSKNLRVTSLKNGDSLYHAKTPDEWSYAESMGIPAYCYRNFVPLDKDFGLIYNKSAVETEMLLPDGFRLPTNEDLQTLKLFTGEYKHLLRSDWGINLNGGFTSFGDNKSGFNASPIGYVYYRPERAFMKNNLWNESVVSFWLSDYSIFTVKSYTDGWGALIGEQSMIPNYFLLENMLTSNLDSIHTTGKGWYVASGIRLISDN